jgi:hypothetical protein
MNCWNNKTIVYNSNETFNVEKGEPSCYIFACSLIAEMLSGVGAMITINPDRSSSQASFTFPGSKGAVLSDCLSWISNLYLPPGPLGFANVLSLRAKASKLLKTVACLNATVFGTSTDFPKDR